MRVENIKDPADYVPAVLEKVKSGYIGKVYGLSDWTDASDFLTKLAVKCGKLLKVMWPLITCSIMCDNVA